MQQRYEAKDIKVLEGLDAVRLRPGMYIGTTGQKGLHHILWEIVDNSIDEIANGYGKKVTVTLNPDGSASVEDDGRGIPVDIHPELGISGVEVVFTQLHAGGKFDTHNYSFSGGLHGVGASVTNALSEWLKVVVYKDGWEYKMEFASVEDENGKIKSGQPQTQLIKVQPTKKKGTLVTFMPDKRVFDSIVFSAEIITKRLKELAFLNKGVIIVFKDLRNEYFPIVKEYCYEGGLSDFARYVNEAKNPLHEPLYFEGEKDGIHLSIAIQYNDSYTDTIISYVNNIPTTEGGTHETGIKAALTRVFNDLARRYGLLKEKEPNLLGDDFREGLTAVISVKMRNVQFEGQTKTKLGNPEARVACETILANELYKYFEKPRTKSVAEKIIQKAIGAARVREASRKAKEITRQKNSLENATLVGKLSSCTSKKPELNELFIVEGDSAGGTAKQARDRYFQAILPLRGKPLNAEKKRLDQVLQNEEIRTIISALGAGIGEDFSVENLNYHKVIILSDADQDGAHIKAILLTFFFRYMKDLINEGYVYLGMPPLYKVYKKDTVVYAYTDEELEEAKEKVGRGYQIQRYKGLGEMNADQLWETTMNPKTRKLIQVTIEDAAEAEKLVTTLMGDAVELRKSYIIEHANFNKDDRLLGEIG
ncbi:MAG TPA: DNA topoisomerase subunit B [Clostridia bacterium]